MPYLTCPSCSLTLDASGSLLDIEHCPRCRARRGIAVEMMVCRRPSAKPGPARIAGSPTRGIGRRVGAERSRPALGGDHAAR